MYLPTLTEPEKLLLAVAARVDTAIRFKEANPGQDYGHYSTNLAEEAKLIESIYKQYPAGRGDQHRVHPSVSIVREFGRMARDSRQKFDVDEVTAEEINKNCHITSWNTGGWPEVLTSKDLSKLAEEQPIERRWWVPECASEEDGDVIPRHSTQLTKGKMSAPSTVDIILDSPTLPQKRRAAAYQHPDVESSDDGEPTPCKGETSVSAPPPKRRLRTNKAGELVDVPDTNPWHVPKPSQEPSLAGLHARLTAVENSTAELQEQIQEVRDDQKTEHLMMLAVLHHIGMRVSVPGSSPSSAT